MNQILLFNFLKEAKPTSKQTGFFERGYFKTECNPQKTIWTIMDSENKGILIKFKNTYHLTIFEHDLLYFLLILKKKPVDYAKYFKCVAGKRFLDNIDEIKIAKKITSIEWEDLS